MLTLLSPINQYLKCKTGVTVLTLNPPRTLSSQEPLVSGISVFDSPDPSLPRVRYVSRLNEDPQTRL